MDIYEKYGTKPFDEFIKEVETVSGKNYDLNFVTEMWALDFLRRTDHIPNKIIEAEVLGNKTEDYIEVLKARQIARDEINKLRK